MDVVTTSYQGCERIHSQKNDHQYVQNIQWQTGAMKQYEGQYKQNKIN